jgi:hypothetical protein
VCLDGNTFGIPTCRATMAGAEWPRAFARPDDYGEPMPKPNYHQARKQKEVARKARQQEKKERRSARVNPADTGESATSPATEGPREASSESPT